MACSETVEARRNCAVVTHGARSTETEGPLGERQMDALLRKEMGIGGEA